MYNMTKFKIVYSLNNCDDMSNNILIFVEWEQDHAKTHHFETVILLKLTFPHS